jgi:hypothetical protein
MSQSLWSTNQELQTRIISYMLGYLGLLSSMGLQICAFFKRPKAKFQRIHGI